MCYTTFTASWLPPSTDSITYKLRIYLVSISMTYAKLYFRFVYPKGIRPDFIIQISIAHLHKFVNTFFYLFVDFFCKKLLQFEKECGIIYQ